MKKIVYFLLISVLLITMSMGLIAHESEYTFVIEGEVISVAGVLTEEQAYELAYIHYCIENDIDIPDMCASCSHTYENQIVTATTHRARATQPRCQNFTYNIKRCTKCYDTTTTLLRSWYEYCCE